MVVDQFEEVFTLCTDPAQRQKFIDLLLNASRPGSRVHVVIAVRADFYGHCAEHRGLAHALRAANLLVEPMNEEELREAIVKPAAVMGVVLERALTSRIIADVADQPGGLPLMSHALLETWHRRRGRTLTLRNYEAVGGVHGAIAHTAEDVYTRLSAEQAGLARQLLLRLIAPGADTPDTRRPARRTELADCGPADAALVLDHLARARLVTLDDDTVDLAHEALITSWPRLHAWLEQDRELLRQHRALTNAATTWDQLDRDPGALYRGTQLALADEVFTAEDQDHLTSLERSFLTTSRDTRERERRHTARTTRRLRALTLALAALLVMAGIAAGLAFDQSQSALAGRQKAVTAQQQALSRQFAAQSSALLDTNTDLASLLAIHAYRTSPTREATESLYAVADVPLEHRLPGPVKGVTAATFSPDGKTLATGSPDRTILLWNSSTGEKKKPLTGRTGLVSSVAYSPDGKQLAAGGDGAQVWDTATGHAMSSLRGRSARSIRAVGFSRNGRALAVGEGGRVWDVGTGQVRTTLKGPVDPEMAATFSPEGDSLATSVRDSTAQIWDVATGRVRFTLTGHSGADVGRDHVHGQKQAEGVGDDEPLAALDLLAGVESPGGNRDRVGGSDGLGVDQPRTGHGVTTVGFAYLATQRVMDALNSAVVMPPREVPVDRRPWSEILRQLPPAQPVRTT